MFTNEKVLLDDESLSIQSYEPSVQSELRAIPQFLQILDVQFNHQGARPLGKTLFHCAAPDDEVPATEIHVVRIDGVRQVTVEIAIGRSYSPFQATDGV